MGESIRAMPSIVLTLTFFALTFSLAAGAACNASDYGVTAKVPCTTVPLCTSSAFGMATIGSQADGRGKFPARTTVKLCYDAQALHLHYEAKDENLFLNHYPKCNTDMWNNEVVEIFLAPSKGAELITHYTEVECSPHNALYVSRIHNPYGNGTDKSNSMVGCEESGVKHTVQLDRDANTWSTSLTVPWALVSDSGDEALQPVRRANLFRVLMKNESAPICNDEQCVYGAWSPTGVYPSNYHVSTALGVLVLEGK